MASVVKGRISIRKCDLNLKMMLEGGQCFRWKKTESDEWTGVFARTVWVLKQFEEHLDFVATVKNHTPNNKKVTKTNVDIKGLEKVLSDYLRCDEDLSSLYKEWSEKDSHFSKAAVQCYGIRMLNQDPVENVFSFICSSNNNIIRITSMVEKLCTFYGEKLVDIEGNSYYAFPEVSALAPDSVEQKLRGAGFGYRAKYIQQAAKQLLSLGGAEWLDSLKNSPYLEAKAQLMKLQGIGPKVADCICLMSLGHLDSVPVDTHVFQIASQYYLPHLKSVKTVTDRIYKEIGDFFRSLYGPYAGWAHTVLFCADLKMFKSDSDLKNVPKKSRKRKSDSGKEIEKSDTNIEHISGVLSIPKVDLHLRVTLNCGQTYRWKEIGSDVWRGIFASRVWILIQHENQIEYTMVRFGYTPSDAKMKCKVETKSNESNKIECEKLLRDYFRLNDPLSSYYEEWSKRDPHFKEIASKFYGLRMTRQDITENIFAFVCSSNNTIARITTMVEHLCTTYGSMIAKIDGKSYYDFPTIDSLSPQKVETELRSANFGFRAKYVQQTAQYIKEKGGSKWLHKLQNMSYDEAKEELMKLPGVGAKVADCICLTALDHLETIPVDTHVFQIAKQHYLKQYSDKKTVSEKIYKEIGNHFRELFGHYAGWAHTILFCSDLKQHGDMESCK